MNKDLEKERREWLEHRHNDLSDYYKAHYDSHKDSAEFTSKFITALNSGAFIACFAFQRHDETMKLIVPLILFFLGLVFSSIL